MTPYFEKNGVTLYNADCRDVLPTLPEKSAGLVLTDPPYAEQTHSNAKTNKGNGSGVKMIDFPSVTAEQLGESFDAIGRVAARWVIATVDWRHMARLESDPPSELRFMRFALWVKPDGMPQISADRPSTGWEAVALLHRADVKPRWDGGGTCGVWIHGVERSAEYPTQKPLPLIQKWLRLFADDSDLVLDPFSGGGTTLVAAYRMGHKAIGCDISERACEVAARRLEREMAQGDLFKRGVA